ncbi:hypothetical protein L1987_66369 [Smallanthus sonchifolius]|uniref:Uncharacterized protein n=1 Tax=Smallanthus sonchifolius TaxID=185202 RepID=A0ACB9BWX7_9ASTR|nr:hypothetical protein L1987_66369 [Smallanthus sonchifolius]
MPNSSQLQYIMDRVTQGDNGSIGGRGEEKKFKNLSPLMGNAIEKEKRNACSWQANMKDICRHLSILALEML